MTILKPDPSDDTRPDPKWARSRTGHYHRLLNLDPEAAGLKGASGVYVVWHAGVRPQWLLIGHSNDLASTFRGLADNDDLMSYQIHGGVYVTWSSVREEFQEGVVRYLVDTLKPLTENTDPGVRAATPIPVRPPRERPTVTRA